MRYSRAELEATLEAEAKQAIREYLDWAESTAAPTLTEIEEAVLTLRKRLGERLAQAVIEAQGIAYFWTRINKPSELFTSQALGSQFHVVRSSVQNSLKTLAD